jgi:tetratricopeptide (TPR) repeat protein
VARHQTLRAAMDWSHELLAPSEQAALRRLAVFPGPFDLEAAEAVVVGAEEEKVAPPGDYYEVLDLLARLVEKSLLAVDAEDVEVRYRLLETVRHYAGEKLTQAGEAEMAHRRHRDFYLALVRMFPSSWIYGGPQAERAEARLCYDYDNFRVALEWSLATEDADASLGLVGPLWVYWLWGGHELEGCTWLERALALSPSPPTLARVESLNGLGYLSSIVGSRDPDQSELPLEEALRLALELDDRIGVSRAHYLLAYLKLGRGDLDGAEQHVRTALEGLEDMKIHRGMGWCQYLLGWLAMARGERGAARAHFEQAVVLSRHSGQPQLTCHALAALPPLLAYYGEAGRAEALADEGVEAARRLGLSTILTMALVRCGEAAILAGHTQRAETAVREALSLLGDVGGRRWVAETLEMAALMLEPRCRHAAAARLFGACDALRQAFGEGRGELRCIYAHVQDGRQRVTEELGEDAYEEQRTQGQGMTVAEAISHALFELDDGSRGCEGDRRRATVTTNISAR